MRDTEACPEEREGASWKDFVERNNPVPSPAKGQTKDRAGGDVGQPGPTSEGTWFCPRHARVRLSFAYKRFDGRVPEPGGLDEEGRALLERVEAGFETVGAEYARLGE